MKAPARAIRSTDRELTRGLRGLPSVLIIGAQKGGTTFRWLGEEFDWT